VKYLELVVKIQNLSIQSDASFSEPVINYSGFSSNETELCIQSQYYSETAEGIHIQSVKLSEAEIKLYSMSVVTEVLIVRRKVFRVSRKCNQSSE
jgi:hypothetical protein